MIRRYKFPLRMPWISSLLIQEAHTQFDEEDKKRIEASEKQKKNSKFKKKFKKSVRRSYSPEPDISKFSIGSVTVKLNSYCTGIGRKIVCCGCCEFVLPAVAVLTSSVSFICIPYYPFLVNGS